MVWCARQFGWPPDVVRRQSWRDLLVLVEAQRELAMMREG